MSKHTPGPWEWQNGSSWWRLGTRGHDGNVLRPVVATYDNHPDLSFKNHADKALIAAAPEILFALKIMYEAEADYITRNNLGEIHHNERMKHARDVIAKAEGRS